MKIIEILGSTIYMLSSITLYFFTYWGLDELLGGHESIFSFEFFMCALIMAALFLLPFNVLLCYPIALYGVSFLPQYYNWVCGGIISYRIILIFILLYSLWKDYKK